MSAALLNLRLERVWPRMQQTMTRPLLIFQAVEERQWSLLSHWHIVVTTDAFHMLFLGHSRRPEKSPARSCELASIRNTVKDHYTRLGLSQSLRECALNRELRFDEIDEVRLPHDGPHQLVLLDHARWWSWRRRVLRRLTLQPQQRQDPAVLQDSLRQVRHGRVQIGME